MHRIIGFQKRLVLSGAFTNPRSHIYYLPELYCAYFGRCYAAFIALPPAARAAIDPDGTFDLIRGKVLAYVQTELIAHEMNAFDAALALIALGHLGADPATFAPALHCIVSSLGEGGRHGPFKAYEWNKMKTPTRILVGGPEVTSAFVLMGLALARRAMMAGQSVASATSPSPGGGGSARIERSEMRDGWGDGPSTRTLLETRDCHPTPRALQRATLPLQGRVSIIALS